MNNIQDLEKALQAGSYNTNLLEGKPLKIESLEAVMRVVTYWHTKITNWFGDKLCPVLDIYGKSYAFYWVGNTWKQVPSHWDVRYAHFLQFNGRKRYYKVAKKKLTPHQIKLANKRLMRYFPGGGDKAVEHFHAGRNLDNFVKIPRS